MIVRKRKVNTSVAELSLHCVYTIVDVRAQLKEFWKENRDILQYSDEELAERQWSQQDLLHYFRQTLFKPFEKEKEFVDALPMWAMVQAVKHRLLFPDVLQPNTYYLSEELAARPGRKKKKEIE